MFYNPAGGNGVGQCLAVEAPCYTRAIFCGVSLPDVDTSSVILLLIIILVEPIWIFYSLQRLLLDEADGEKEPHAGGVYAAKVGFKGQTEGRFVLAK